MSFIDSVTTFAAAASQAVQAGQANTAAGTTPTQAEKMGLPPVGLANAASTNSLNAGLVSSQWGVDPASVAGVYGGAAVSGGLFAGDTLLPALTHLTHANAAQSLALLGVRTPTPGGNPAAASAYAGTGTTPMNSEQATSTSGRATLDQAAAGAAGPAVVDPLWGRNA